MGAASPLHLRLARESAGRRLIAALAALCAAVSIGAAACSRPSGGATLSVTLDPAAPVVGTPTTVRMTLRRADGTPLPAANVRVEAHMTHPGMTPVLPEVVRLGDGEFESRLEFSMAGDWLIAVTGELPDGQRFTLQAPVTGVDPKTP